jgi:hypothetical protein
MARGADGTQFHEEPVHIRHGPKPGILSGERAETLNDLLTTGNGREGKVAGRLLIAPPVQHRLEHLLGGVEQRHIPGDLPPRRAGRTQPSARIISSHDTRCLRILCGSMAKRPVEAGIFHSRMTLLRVVPPGSGVTDDLLQA